MVAMDGAGVSALGRSVVGTGVERIVLGCDDATVGSVTAVGANVLDPAVAGADGVGGEVDGAEVLGADVTGTAEVGSRARRRGDVAGRLNGVLVSGNTVDWSEEIWCDMASVVATIAGLLVLFSGGGIVDGEDVGFSDGLMLTDDGMAVGALEVGGSDN